MRALARRSLTLALVTLVLASAAPAHALFADPLTASKCAAGKVECIAKLKTCFTKCHEKALKSGLAVEAACLERCRDAFDRDPAIPGKGCFAKLEAKGGCGASLGDAAVFAAKVEAQVGEAMAQLVPSGGNPENRCAAGKTACLRKFGSCILTLTRKAAHAGTTIGDTSKCARFLSLDANSCVAKLEKKYCDPGDDVGCTSTAPPCLTFQDAVALRNADDAFTNDAIFALETGPADIDNQRCNGDTSVKCTSAPGGVAGCGGPLGTCEFFFGAPIPFTALVQLCVTRQWSGSITGTFDQATGASAGTAAVLSTLYNGISVTQPCPRCQGDPFPNDGASAGTCSGGVRNGLACDGNGQSPEPAWGTTSLDCPPSGSPLANWKLDFSNSTGTITRTLGAAGPNCAGAPGKECLCGTCTGDPTVPCMGDGDCSIAGGACSGIGGEPQKPSSCVDDTANPIDGSLCAPVGNGKGICPEGPVEQRCVMESFRICTVPTENVDCPLPGDSCGIQNRGCFPGYHGNVGDTVTATGAPGALRNGATPMALGSLFCVAPTAAPLLNALVGYPGPARLQLTGVGADDGGPGCPTTASFLPTDKAAALDSGWTGVAHDLEAVGQGKITVATSCTGTYPNCACSYTGPIANPNIIP